MPFTYGRVNPVTQNANAHANTNAHANENNDQHSRYNHPLLQAMHSSPRPDAHASGEDWIQRSNPLLSEKAEHATLEAHVRAQRMLQTQ
jgi:hypothetical protein